MHARRQPPRALQEPGPAPRAALGQHHPQSLAVGCSVDEVAPLMSLLRALGQTGQRGIGEPWPPSTSLLAVPTCRCPGPPWSP